MQGFTVTTFYALAAWFGLTLFTIQSWWSPPTVVILGLIFITLPAVIFAFLVDKPLRETPNAKDVAPIILTALVIGVGGGALWFIPQLRAKAIEQVGQSKALGKAINSSHPMIRLGACKKYLKDNTPTRTMYLKLANRPTLAYKCIEAVPSYAGRGSLEESLSKDWYKRLFSSTKGSTYEESRMCTMAQTMDSFSMRASFDQDFRMLDCSINSPVEGRRYCCASILKKRKKVGGKLLAMILADENKTVDYYIPGPLVGLAFGEGETVKRLKHVKSELKLPVSAIQKASLKIACTGYLQSKRGLKAERYLAWLFAQDNASSCMSMEQKKYAGKLTTDDVCTHTLKDLMTSDDIPKTICQAKLNALQHIEKEKAKRAKYNAEALAEMSADIQAGHNYRNTKGLNINAMMKNIQQQGDSLRYGGSVMPGGETYSEADRKVFISKVMGQVGTVPTDPRAIRKLRRAANKRLGELKMDPKMKGLMDARKPNGKIDMKLYRQAEREAKNREIQAKLKGAKVRRN